LEYGCGFASGCSVALGVFSGCVEVDVVGCVFYGSYFVAAFGEFSGECFYYPGFSTVFVSCY